MEVPAGGQSRKKEISQEMNLASRPLRERFPRLAASIVDMTTAAMAFVPADAAVFDDRMSAPVALPSGVCGCKGGRRPRRAL